MPAEEFDPTRLPAAGGYVPVVFRLYRALAALDEAVPRTVGICRAAALRYVESLQPQGVGPGGALRLLRVAAAAWAPSRLTADQRLRLDARLRFWVGTVYRLRWGPTPPEVPPSAAGA